jgi:hypothetical protein
VVNPVPQQAKKTSKQKKKATMTLGKGKGVPVV